MACRGKIFTNTRGMGFMVMLPFMLVSVSILVVTLPLVCEFALSLQVPAALASDEVLEVVHSVDAGDPTDTARWATWETR